MAGQGIVSKLKKKERSVSVNTTVVIGWTYYVTSSITITLPSTTSLVAGDKVFFYKNLTSTPIIVVNGGAGEVIKMQGYNNVLTDTSATYDIDEHIMLVWNGADAWEVKL